MFSDIRDANTGFAIPHISNVFYQMQIDLDETPVVRLLMDGVEIFPNPVLFVALPERFASNLFSSCPHLMHVEENSVVVSVL
jgi:hypothetical protein